VLVGAMQGANQRRAAAYARAIDVLQTCGLVDVANRRAADLGLLDRKRLELGRALATDPKVLFLDEIGGGLTDAEAIELVSTIKELRSRGIAIIWIEHIVHVLVQAIDRLVCLDAGRIIADGLPDAVLNDAAVIDAYLGASVT
jgi:branched-chain amino acid transport system ATP-binding protein